MNCKADLKGEKYRSSRKKAEETGSKYCLTVERLDILYNNAEVNQIAQLMACNSSLV